MELFQEHHNQCNSGTIISIYEKSVIAVHNAAMCEICAKKQTFWRCHNYDMIKLTEKIAFNFHWKK